MTESGDPPEQSTPDSTAGDSFESIVESDAGSAESHESGTERTSADGGPADPAPAAASGGATTPPANADGGEDPTPQSVELRRQQYFVGIAGGVIAGLALTTSLFQRFPDAPAALHVFAGVVAFGFVIWLVRKSVFPGEDDVADLQ